MNAASECAVRDSGFKKVRTNSGNDQRDPLQRPTFGRRFLRNITGIPIFNFNRDGGRLGTSMLCMYSGVTS